MDDDWFDKVVDGEPKEAELWQLAYIESKLHHTSITLSEQSSIMGLLNNLSEEEADEIIKKIKENEVKNDPQDQYKEMFRNGMFNGGDNKTS
jgi:hypothetical protein